MICYKISKKYALICYKEEKRPAFIGVYFNAVVSLPGSAGPATQQPGSIFQ